MIAFEPRLHAGRHAVVGGPGELGHGLEALGIALHPEAVDVPFEVVVVHLEQVGGDHLRLGLDLAAAMAVAAPDTGVEREP